VTPATVEMIRDRTVLVFDTNLNYLRNLILSEDCECNRRAWSSVPSSCMRDSEQILTSGCQTYRLKSSCSFLGKSNCLLCSTMFLSSLLRGVCHLRIFVQQKLSLLHDVRSLEWRTVHVPIDINLMKWSHLFGQMQTEWTEIIGMLIACSVVRCSCSHFSRGLMGCIVPSHLLLLA